MRFSSLTLIALFAFSVLHSVWIYPSLPESVASHFGPDGSANGNLAKKTFLGLFAMSEFMALFSFLIVPILIKSLPKDLINLPNKDYWLAEERIAATQKTLSSQLFWMGAGTLLFLFMIKKHLIDINLPSDLAQKNLGAFFPLATGLYLLFVLLWTLNLYRAYRLPVETAS